MMLAEGTRLGPYQILSKLGAGNMGVVYRAYDSRLERTVAIKVLTDVGEIGSQRLLHEARAASALNHPHICIVHEVGESDGRAFIVMEYADGKPLSELIPHDGLPAAALVRYGVQIADALAHAHDHGVLHRDLKSSNVIITKDGRAKVVDFGLARRLTQLAPDASTASMRLDAGKLAGTLSYMAPEVLRGESPSIASDLWALGVLLYELSSGRLPFTGRTTFELTAAIQRGALPPLPTHTPASIRMIVARCLDKEPGQRYRTAGEVRAALQAVQSDAAMPTLSPVVRWHQSIQGRILAAGLLVVVAVGAILLTVDSDEQASSTSDSGRLRLIVGSDQRAFDPALSPDGKMIAYIAEDDSGRLDLVVARVAGGGRVRLTDDEAREGHPRFSPDGERILFQRLRRDTGEAELCAVPALGGEVSVVLPGAAHAAWSSDGNRIAFIQVQGAGTARALATARIDGSDVRVLLPADAAYPSLRHPAWSPDGTTIAVVRGTGGVAAEIWFVASQGGQLTRFSNDPPAVFSDEPVFSADGLKVVYSSNRGGATNIWSSPVAGGPPARLTTGPGPDESPTVARNGEVAFVNTRWRSGLIVHDLPGRRTRTLLTHTPFLWAPAFSPDSKEIAFSRSEVDGAWHIWLTAVDGGPARRLTSTPLGELYPRYLPDGVSVIYHTWGTPRRVWRVSRYGGPAVALTPDAVDASFGDISPDGASLVFVATEENKVERIYTLALAGTLPRLVTTSPASLPRWSPDGAWITFASDRGYTGGIWIVRPDGSDERRLTQTGGWPVWWPDAGRIAYLTITAEGRQQINIVALERSKSEMKIDVRFEGTNNPFDISRDGGMLATSNAVHFSDEIWLLQRSP